MTQPGDALSGLVRETVRELLLELRAPERTSAGGGAGELSPARSAEAPPASAQFVTESGPRRRTEAVRIESDKDLAVFVARILSLADNPKTRADLRNGWLRFSLAGPTVVRAAGGRASATSGRAPALRVDRGLVTERTVEAAAEQGRPLLTAKGVVVTPLARDKARSLGVDIEKEL